MADHLHEHVSFCEKTNVATMRKNTPAAACRTCQSWWMGYAAALNKLQPLIQGESDDE